MTDTPVGSAWLKYYYKLYAYHLTHCSFIGTNAKKEIDESENVIEVYRARYAPAHPKPLDHVEFSLKYDDLNMDFLKAVFELIPIEEVVQFIALKPKGIYQRKIGFLYEFLTKQKIPVADVGRVNYVDLLDNSKYLTGNIIKNQRWSINDNLLGNPDFCPVIRRTKSLELALQEDYQKLITNLTKIFPPDIFHRAVNYLYTKETRSSYQIEKEKPSPERVNRFVRLLEKAGEQPSHILLSEPNLTKLQNEIVDPRYAAQEYRNFQNYIGQTTFNFKEIIHYICPPPAYLPSIMEGLAVTADKTAGIPPVVRAAIIAFGFVFAHPFEDGNGRLHRFLIHDMLARDHVVPPGMIIPVSAHMVNHIKEYDEALEVFSVPLMKRIRYEAQDDHSLTVTNPEQVAGYFRYPDLTGQSIYLANTIKATITEDIYQEMEFLVKYDEVKHAIQEIVDIPDKDIDLFIKFLHQHRGTLPIRRRKSFDKLTDEEIARMEIAFQEIFGLDMMDTSHHFNQD